MPERLTITRLGVRGDGIAETAGWTVYVPFALPGEVVTAEVAGERGRLLRVEEAGPGRREPECPLFTRCGGCAMQHLAETHYRAWKRDGVLVALQRAGLDAPVADLVDAHGEGRRRVTFHARRVDGETHIGFMAARSHALVPIEACPVLSPGLARAPAAALALARLLEGSGKPLDFQVTATTAGLDLDIRGLGAVKDILRQALVTAAERLDLARLSLHGEVLVERRPPAIAMGRAVVVPPAGGFLQATAAGEDALAERVTAACSKAKRIVDLFAGCGPFALRLAERAEVHAVEGSPEALVALDRAFRATPGLKRITTETRDLFRRPLLPPELDRFDAVVFDPPRAGAEAQARQIAASKVPLVVGVSCDVGTFTRDARLLVDAGMRLVEVVPVDQFRYSPHVEIVGIFRRPDSHARARGGRR
ncbi:RNA methyltransferase [Chelatococcus sp. SYSU_G07232]|uniref:RNA methyltransferase n=1 Tax=Chelatococcus albus TaxID=3047466 RepID=A0ABT7AEH4_9HYPH|nr:RNA methyltransferase [Chelatococcus sp. SYSU_G07232]MDJ1157774.1 RNA methyltransferase [Chelatococcus sp. SYSU_G07232]